MSNTVTAMSTAITEEGLWSSVATIMPFVATVTVFAIGFYLVKRVLRRTSKLKSGF